MYRKILEEMTKQGLTKKALADKARIKYCTFLGKLNKDYEFTLDEAIAVRDALGVSMSVEELFEYDEVAA